MSTSQYVPGSARPAHGCEALAILDVKRSSRAATITTVEVERLTEEVHQLRARLDEQVER
ncbi:hypothetical protein [Tenggerimyces flavus]|uniref:Uncharacterized protein n=1 Tax=Tenggerimyces flavus TaxID=1708749 RepID=A0ABV7YI87_9ACTN|nr:hypothetical protein [Tenggerimyces flavus]MBM7786815.1 hypothetical protein [Tenggerimyces flavus]